MPAVIGQSFPYFFYNAGIQGLFPCPVIIHSSTAGLFPNTAATANSNNFLQAGPQILMFKRWETAYMAQENNKAASCLNITNTLC